MTENDKNIIESAESILNDAIQQEKETLKAEALRLFCQLEKSLWDNDPLTEVYDLWAVRLAHKGTPESLHDYRHLNQQFDDKAVIINSPDTPEPCNSALAVRHAYSASESMPENIVGLLHNLPAILMIHEDLDDGPLVGLLLRTGGHATQRLDIRPSQDDDALDVVITTMILRGFIMSRVRREDGTELDDTPPQVTEVAEFRSLDDKEAIVNCLEEVAECGRVYEALYSAFIMPIMMKHVDPAMYAAVLKDVSSSTDDEQTQNNKEK